MLSFILCFSCLPACLPDVVFVSFHSSYHCCHVDTLLSWRHPSVLKGDSVTTELECCQLLFAGWVINRIAVIWPVKSSASAIVKVALVLPMLPGVTV